MQNMNYFYTSYTESPSYDKEALERSVGLWQIVIKQEALLYLRQSSNLAVTDNVTDRSAARTPLSGSTENNECGRTY